MDCARAREKLGPYVDGELPDGEAHALQEHVRDCPDCTAELGRIEALVRQLERAAGPSEIHAPTFLWADIEARLEWGATQTAHHGRKITYPRRPTWVTRFLRRPLAAAASLGLLIGGGVTVAFLVQGSAQKAQAAAIDYAVLLDGLAQDADAAVDRFLRHYSAEPIAPKSAPAAVPGLSFRLPPELPGGYRQEAVYRVRFGTAEGVVGRYRRASEPLVVFFHPPIGQTRLGVHRESECHVAGREGQRVEVGPWQLVHFTDPSTCHCLLSKIGDEAGQSAILAAIAPQFRAQPPGGQ